MNLAEIAALLNFSCDNTQTISGVCIDSRQVKAGNLFIAMQGERFDSHDFLLDVEKQGAIGIVCSRLVPNIKIPQWVVADPLEALAKIATHYRQKLACEVIALTGSNGKTSVKEMIAAILPQPSFATPGNLNNHIGVPLSVLQLQPSHRYAVFELGANHRGEIAHTVAIVKPKVTLINNIAPAHIEGFGSIDGVANAKGEIHQGLIADGIAIINDDDAYAHYWDSFLTHHQIIRFSIEKKTSVHARNITFNAEGCARFVLVTPQGEEQILLRVPGRHNISNALAAAACTHALGIELANIVSGLERFQGVTGRMTHLIGKQQALIIDDTYNANLRSVLTAIEVLAKRAGTRILVFGDMGELGAWSKQHHEDVGIAAKEQGIELLMTCGQQSRAASLAFGDRAKHYDSQDELISDLLPQLDSQTTVLVKGSRSSAMENIVQKLVD